MDEGRGMGGHNLGCGDDDDEDERIPDQKYYENKIAKGNKL